MTPSRMPSNPTQAIMVTDVWRTVDRWWTNEPTIDLFISFESPEGQHAAVRWSAQTKEFTLLKESL